MAFPVLFLTIALGAGIAAAAAFSPPAGSATAGTVVLLAAAWFFYGRKKLKAALVLLLAAAAGLGAGLFAAFESGYEKNGLRGLADGRVLRFHRNDFPLPRSRPGP